MILGPTGAGCPLNTVKAGACSPLIASPEWCQRSPQEATAQLGQWTTPEACYKKAHDLYKQDKNWQDALVVLHVGI